MSDRYAVVNSGTLGTAYDGATGLQYRVVFLKHANPIPGFKDETAFAVEESRDGNVVRAWGFTNPQDCFHFLTNEDEHEYQVPNMRGELEADKRTGIGLPDGAVKVWKDAGSYGVANASGTAPTTPANEPAFTPTEQVVSTPTGGEAPSL